MANEGVEQQQIADLEARLALLEARVNQIAISAERVFEFQALHPTAGEGTNGSSKQSARSDHTH